MFGYWENWEQNIRIIFWMIMFDVVWCLKKLYERVCNFVNLEIVNWGIHLVNNLSTLLYSPSKFLQFGGIKNEGWELVETPPNPSPSFFKKLPNKIIELLSLPLLYSPSFFKHLNRPLENIVLVSLYIIYIFFLLESTYISIVNWIHQQPIIIDLL